jgi:hypothetical protein
MQKSAYVIVAALGLVLLATGPLVAQPPTATFDLTGVEGAVLAGVFTSPYYGSVGGGTTIPVICDDFSDESYVPEDWTAYVTPVSGLTSSTTDSYLKWLNTPGSTITVDSYSLSQATAYTVAAVLATDILTSAAGSSVQQDYSYALWELFDPSDAEGQLAGYTSDLTNSEAYLNNAVTYVENNNIMPSAYANVTIYSYDSAFGTSCGGGSCPPPPQEFISVNVAEAPPLAESVLYFLLVGGSFLFFGRRRILRADS